MLSSRECRSRNGSKRGGGKDAAVEGVCWSSKRLFPEWEMRVSLFGTSEKTYAIPDLRICPETVLEVGLNVEEASRTRKHIGSLLGTPSPILNGNRVLATQYSNTRYSTQQESRTYKPLVNIRRMH